MDRLSTTSDRRPPLPFFTYVLVPYFTVAVAVAFRPTFPSLWWRLALVVGFPALLVNGLKYDTGETLRNYSIGAEFGNMTWTAVLLLLLTDPIRECRHETHEEEMIAMPWWKRVYWAVCLRMNTRGVGWNFQIEQLTARPNHTRSKFILNRIKRILWFAFLADVADTYIDLNPIFAPGPQVRSIRAQGPILTVSNVVAYSSMLYYTLNVSYDALALFGVALRLSEPTYWPLPFGRWRDAYTVRRFWGRTWHQMSRRFVATIGRATARFLGFGRGTWLSSKTQLFVGFTVSGLCHVCGDAMVDRRWTGSSYWYFLAQAAVITLEDAVVALGRRVGIRDSRAARGLGYAWTVAWLMYVTPFYIDWAVQAGLGTHRVFKGSVVKPVLRWVAEATGFDVMTWFTELCTLSM